MKKIIFLISMLAFMHTNAQQIEIKKSFGEVQLYKDGLPLKMKDARKLMENQEAAIKDLRKAATNRTFAYIFGTIGGALIGYPVGTAIGGGDPEWALAGIGAGFVGLSIPFISGYNKRARSAAELYNASVTTTTTSSFQPDVRFHVKGNGLSLVIEF